LDISQYVHTTWRTRDGFTEDIQSIAQTADGYLWLGTGFGLFRFDGVKAVLWRPPAGESLPANQIWSLLATRDGTLWIGTAKGLSSWKNGKVTHYPDLARAVVRRLLEDHEGTVWVGTLGTPTGKLCTIRTSSVQCEDDRRFSQGVFSLYEDRNRILW